MDKNIIEQYKKEMLELFKSGKVLSVQSDVSPIITDNDNEKGGLVAIVTTFRGIYPVKNANVTIFTGNIDDKQIISTDKTDVSGRTGVFMLNAPLKELSRQPDRNALPYASYNMLIEADGYIDNIHLNIPVFSGVTSLQGSDMMLIETAGTDKNAQIFDESTNYNL